MPMDYKICPFDYAAFKQELAELLFRALDEDDLDELATFIDANVVRLKEPQTGQPLDASWRKKLKPRVVHDFANIALTVYYAPDQGTVVKEWMDLDDFLRGIQDDLGGLILGSAFGPAHNVFDPGTTAAYFQTPLEAKRSLPMLEMLIESQQDEISEHEDIEANLQQIMAVFSSAIANEQGIYVTC